MSAIDISQKFRKEILALHIIIRKLISFMDNRDRVKVAGYDFYNKYYESSDDERAKIFIIGYGPDSPNKSYDDRLRLDFHRYSYRLYSVQVFATGHILARYLQGYLKQHHITITTEMTNKFPGEINCVTPDQAILRACLEAIHEAPYDKHFDPISVLNDLKISLGYTYMYPDCGTVVKNLELDTDSFSMDKISFFNGLIDGIIKGAKDNTVYYP